jgi:multiple antibiotic resistance protein
VATIIFTQRTKTGGQWLSLALGIICVHIVLYLAMRFSEVIRRLVRDAGILLITRVAGVLLAAIAVQMTADGIRTFIRAG